MILLIDTSTARLLVGLGTEDGKLVAFHEAIASENERGIHDARLALEVSGILAEHEVGAKSISKIGIVIGPGSFTGLRIGLAFAKGFASAWQAKIIPIVKHELLSVPSAPAELQLVTDGYQPLLAYVASNGSPKSPRLIKRTELEGMSVRLESELSARELIERLLALTLSGEAADLASVEPLYLVDFVTGVTK